MCTVGVPDLCTVWKTVETTRYRNRGVWMDVCRRSSQYRVESTACASLALFTFLNSVQGELFMLMIKELLQPVKLPYRHR